MCTGGHPFLTQQLCQEVWERAYGTEIRPPPPPPHLVTPTDVEKLVAPTLRSATNALEWLWNGLGAAERIIASALAGAGMRSITQDELETRLQESGVRILIGRTAKRTQSPSTAEIDRTSGRRISFRVELLRRWVAERKPLSRGGRRKSIISSLRP